MIKKILIVLMMISSVATASSKIAELSRAPEIPFHPPAIKSVTLSNGMKCYLIEDKSLPIIQGHIYLKGGTIYEDGKKLGAGSVMANLLKEGGTANNDAAKIRVLLDENAIDAGFSISLETIEGSFASLSKDADMAMKLFFEMLFEPAFSEDSLKISKKRLIDSLNREKETAAPIAYKEFSKLVYGKDNPWGRHAEVSDIKKINRADVVEFYERFASPDRIILAMAGDFNKKDLIAKLEAFAKKYPKKVLPEVVTPGSDARDFPEEKVIKKKFTQSAINIGHLGGTRDDPNKFVLILLNDIYGGSGSFTDRLKEAVRVKSGLAYEIHSTYSFGPKDAPGLFQVHAKTRNKTVGKVIDLVQSELEKLVKEGATAAELKKAKDSLLNSFIFEYERPYELAAGVARFVYFGYPEDYIEISRRGIEKVTLKELNEAAEKYLHPDKLKIVVVGSK